MIEAICGGANVRSGARELARWRAFSIPEFSDQAATLWEWQDGTKVGVPF
jgi:hypothetical protein